MEFSSYTFVVFFLPAVVLGAIVLMRRGTQRARLLFLAGASLVFYSWWDWRFTGVLALSLIVNFMVGRALASAPHRGMLAAGIAFNLLLLGYFKYVDFFIGNLNAVTGIDIATLGVVLPLGISFFTFQQIAYLVDVHRREAVEHSFSHYLLFVTFFPQLIAGPIVHHKEMMPQFVGGRAGRVLPATFSQGLAIFVVGLFKKVMIADSISQFADPVFDAAAGGVAVPMLEAWGGVTAYSFQIYFDFSAYSDMAIGLGLMFGLRLPINFNSPYKATSIVDFWRRWHITLSRFLRDYLYIPLGGSRRGPWRRYANLAIVMLLGGLWHGAAWTFVIWGALHGAALAATHFWRRNVLGRAPHSEPRTAAGRTFGVASTFLFVTVAWVFFRAPDLDSAVILLSGMAGLNGIVLPHTYFSYLGPLGPAAAEAGIRFEEAYLFLGFDQLLWLFGLLALVWGAPNTLQWAVYRPPAGTPSPRMIDWAAILRWRPSAAWAVTLSAASIACLVFMSRGGTFLYFQF
ncbi:MAG: MBOAT family protein [Alphaproteobacteria bacterium]|nr:MBOAT family protein [Alphaproteobacteria bacterium]